jgi:hypothetical protein
MLLAGMTQRAALFYGPGVYALEDPIAGLKEFSYRFERASKDESIKACRFF